MEISRYLKLMCEKEEEERLEIEQRLEEILQNHAAKVIQKGWRKFTKKRNMPAKQEKTKAKPKKTTK